MKKTVYLLLLLAVGVSACSKQKTEEPSPYQFEERPDLPAPMAAPGYITCNEDGVISTLPARAFYSPASATQQYDQLTIATYDPATGRQPGFQLQYQKAAGAADNTYKLVLTDVKYRYSSSSGTLTKTSAGWSGTFIASFTPVKSYDTYWLGSGSFTDIKE